VYKYVIFNKYSLYAFAKAYLTPQYTYKYNQYVTLRLIEYTGGVKIVFIK